MPLPIEAVLPDLLAALEAHSNALLRAPTGAGKTTRVPGALLDRASQRGAVVMLEPRRIAARAAARRIASERGVPLGDEVGYSVRFDDRTSSATRLCVMTEGLFLRRLQRDPFLEGIGAVVFDEFHERHLSGDLALALARRVQGDVREDLQLVVMSATLESDPLVGFLGGAPLVESEGRLYPVEVRHVSDATARGREARLEQRVQEGVTRALRESPGDVLVFLPGRAEIHRARARLEGTPLLRGVRLLELYGDLDARAQDAVLRPGGGRKVVLSTNLAETSLTIPGVTAVVDSGLVRRLSHDPRLGLDRLELAAISRASARQRAGRAGREAPGVCYRLWSAAEERGRAEEDVPEVRRLDLARPLLEVLSFGERDPEVFPWFEAPPAASLGRARELLLSLGAVEPVTGGELRVTELGHRLAGLPLTPRLGRLLLEGARLGVAREAATSAALLSERSPYVPGDRRRAPRVSAHGSDLLDALYDLETFEGSGGSRGHLGELSRGGARHVLAVRDDLARSVRDEREVDDPGTRDEAALRALWSAFPDRLARRRPDDPERARMVGGRGVRLAPECGVREGELFVCLDLDGGQGESLVRRASGVERSWIPDERLTRERVSSFDPAVERVSTRELLRFEDLVLEERELPTARDDASARALREAARATPERALDLARPEVASWLARLECVRAWRPDLDWPKSVPALLDEAIEELCEGRTSFAELRRAPLLETLRAHLGWRAARDLDELAPERLEVPSGSRIALAYEPGRPPVLAARIQELFGLRETPRVAGGRVPVLLHLCAPNMRPQQVTSDLESFWSTTYAEVRKELRRRYPKHAWPEDPTTAQAVRGVPRRH